MIKSVLIVGLGSFMGGVFRYVLSVGLCRWCKILSFPISIFMVNILGCFLIGILYGYFKNREVDSYLVLLLMTGVLGGFTTFSTFSLEVLHLFQQNELLKATFYIVGSVGLGILACFLGYIIGNR